MKKSDEKRILQIARKTVFETGNPDQYIRAADVAFLIRLADQQAAEIKRLKGDKK